MRPLWALLFASAALSAAPVAGARSDEFLGKCLTGPGKGAQVEKASYCDLFRLYDTDPHKPLDTRIGDALKITSAGQTRAIGLVISISHYPGAHIAIHDLPAAAVDGERMVQFLINTQQFDEVIHLKDEKADFDTIRYFLKTYLPAHVSEYGGKARVLIAYSGHGRFGGEPLGAQSAALVLAAADSMTATSGVYDMQDFFKDVKLLAGVDTEASRNRSPFHLITLVNACFGGEIFSTSAGGGNSWDYRAPGSYALTAGDDKHEVPSLIANRGSLFFDLLIDGVTSGRADPQYWSIYKKDRPGAPPETHGLTRFGALAGYLTGEYDEIVAQRKLAHFEDVPLSAPWDGPAQADVARGSFFFLSDRGTAPTTDLISLYSTTQQISQTAGFGERTARVPALTIPTGPISALPGQPSVHIFKAPEIYPVRGFDVSSAEGPINWPKLRDAEHPRFIYARAFGWNGPDPSLEDRMEGAKAIGADFGAYTKFDYCLSAKEQLGRFRERVRATAIALPVAIELINPSALPQDTLSHKQSDCLRNNFKAEQGAMLQLASGLEEAYGKTPLLFGNRYDLLTLTDKRSDRFMSWVGHYNVENVRKTGTNPWTLWQYSGTLNIAGIGPNTTGDAFFGTEAQYHLFRAGKGNVALTAALENKPPQ